MEQLLHYVWKHRLFPLKSLKTTTGLAVEVIDPGLHNHDAGPDFFNAKVKIGETVWVGNVEIHDKASDWYLHHHHGDSHYDNVVLHVVGVVDTDVQTKEGRLLPQMQLEVPCGVRENYHVLLQADKYPPCHRVIPQLPALVAHAWMSRLQTERLEQKTERICQRVERCNGSWEEAYFMTLARNYGFGINGEAFEQWAAAVPLLDVAHHRDNLFQVEALFMGQAGLLAPEAVPERYREAAVAEGYLERLRKEYLYLSHKFGLRPVDHGLWRFLRLRPQNFPHIRIAQLANLCHEQKMGLARLVDCKDVKTARALLRTGVTPYWETHYMFGAPSKKSKKQLSEASLDLLLINTAAPMLFAYGRHRQVEEYCDRALAFLEQIKAENNHVVRMWKECGLSVDNAGDSQALMQLKKEYCDKKDCLRCRMGYLFLAKGNKAETTVPTRAGKPWKTE